MCGIAGVAGRQTSSRLVAPMLDALSRRGPDSEGLSEWGNAVLGHRRLAIFDLSAAGHQPMLSPDRTIGIVFNGAIYNFHDLRRELKGSDRKSTRLNSSHSSISYAVFCLKKKKKNK